MIQNLFRKFSLAHVRGYHELYDWQKDLFDEMYKRHLSALSLETKRKYSEYYLQEVKVNQENLMVYFAHGEVFEYSKDKSWRKIFE